MLPQTFAFLQHLEIHWNLAVFTSIQHGEASELLMSTKNSQIRNCDASIDTSILCGKCTVFRTKLAWKGLLDSKVSVKCYIIESLEIIWQASYRDKVATVLPVCTMVVVCKISMNACRNLLINWSGSNSRLLRRCIICYLALILRSWGIASSLSTPKKVTQRTLPTTCADSTAHSY